MKLLIVEDDINTVEAVRLCLEIYFPNAAWEATAQGLTALEKVREGTYDGVLVDLGLPDIDGLELIERLRTFSRLPVLVVSARHNPEVIARALRLGANDYITKPYDTWNLLKTLSRLLPQEKTARKKLSPPEAG